MLDLHLQTAKGSPDMSRRKPRKILVQKCSKTEVQIKNNEGTAPSLISGFVSVPSMHIQSTKVEDGSTI